jgi:hypothetical protein
MHMPCKTNIEKAWLVASLIILFLHRMMEASPPDYHAPDSIIMLWLEVAMVALSFPFGWIVMYVIGNATFWCDECRNFEWMLDWSTLLLAGYIQWFWVLPGFLRGRQLTLLNLRPPDEVVLLEVSAAPAAKAPPVAPAVTANSSALLFAEFDEAGLTALDRVLRASPPSPPAL